MEQRRCCPHCGQPMLLIPCDDCDGFGGWWEPAPEPDGWRWHVCPDCHDTGRRWKCLDFMRCPGTRWYPLVSAGRPMRGDRRHAGGDSDGEGGRRLWTRCAG